ncbi:allantoate permease [Scheffersomyces xylosifermentans]|uniref:allantoate permease n=1 Tax=Scheffersomyces xylosifermentans TaxID=1304137 RepID=UPI00315DB865
MAPNEHYSLVDYSASSAYNSTDDSDEAEVSNEESSPFVVKKKASNLSTSIRLIGSDSDSLEQEYDEGDRDDIDDAPNPFLDPKVAHYYRTLYEGSEYECRHLYDPDFTWTKGEDERVVKKVDGVIALFACILFTGLQIDRGNLSQALSDNLLGDLGMTTNDYNMGNTIFLVCFMMGEIPSSILSKWIGVDRFIPFQMITWSIIASMQCFLTGKYSFFLARALTAFLESGLIAELVLFLSTYYKSRELPIRLSWLWVTLSVVQIGGAIFSLAILRLRGLFGWEGWRWLFLIEGLITLGIGISAYHMLIPSPIELVERGWFSEKEVKIIVNRILRDDPSKGDTNNRSGVTAKQLIKVLLDFDLWPIYLVGLIAFIPLNTLSNYIPIIYREAGLSAFQTNLLLIPHYILHITFLLQITKLSERLNQRALVAILTPLYLVPLVAIFKYKRDSLSVWGIWLLSTLIAGGPYVHAICVSWVSRNSGSIKTRSVSAAVYNLIVQAGAIIAANLYRSDDAPLYHRGNSHLLWFAFAMVPLLLSIKGYYLLRNRWKQQTWDAMSPEEQSSYLHHSSELGNKRLDFRFDS